MVEEENLFNKNCYTLYKLKIKVNNMNRLFLFVIIIMILSFSSVVYAAKNEAGSQGSGQNTINQIQNQNEVQTQN